jgi:probable F420-dependent oxidoreductase
VAYHTRTLDPRVFPEVSVEFGFALSGRGPLAQPDVMLRLATKADTLGYASLFVTDHVLLPASAARSIYPYSPTGQFPGGASQDYFEPLSVMGYLAHATKRIRLGTSVLVVPYRNPLVVAKMLATIDVLSGGRVILGAGVGWLAEEFEALEAKPFAERGSVTDEYLRLMRVAWTEDPVSFESRHYRVKDVHVLPKPRQRHVPVWIGGHTEAALRRTARLGDGWHPIGNRPPSMMLPDEYAAKTAELHRYTREAGRDPAAITLTLRVPMQVRSAKAKALAGDRPPFQGTAAEVRSDVDTYAALGVSHIVFDSAIPDPKAAVENLERFAGEVMSKYKRKKPAEKKTPVKRARRSRTR